LATTVFEWHPAKNEANFAKHGLWFEQAAEVWHQPYFEKTVDRMGEMRWLRVTQIDGNFCLIVYTERRKKIRIISVRRISDEERRKLGDL